MTPRNFRILIQHCCAYCALPTRHEDPPFVYTCFDYTKPTYLAAQKSGEAKVKILTL